MSEKSLLWFMMIDSAEKDSKLTHKNSRHKSLAYQDVTDGVLANSCLVTHPAAMEEH